MPAWLGLLTAVATLLTIIVPKVWKSPQDAAASRNEKAKEDWDAYYKKTE